MLVLAGLYALNLLLLVLLLIIVLRQSCPSRLLTVLACVGLIILAAHTLLLATVLLLT